MMTARIWSPALIVSIMASTYTFENAPARGSFSVGRENHHLPESFLRDLRAQRRVGDISCRLLTYPLRVGLHVVLIRNVASEGGHAVDVRELGDGRSHQPHIGASVVGI